MHQIRCHPSSAPDATGGLSIPNYPYPIGSHFAVKKKGERMAIKEREMKAGEKRDREKE